MFNKQTRFGSGWFESSSSNGGLFGSSSIAESDLFGNNMARGSPKTGTTFKFKAPQGQDSVIKNGSNQTITTDQCIVAMEEYEGKGLEELRLEDNTEGRRNAKQPGTIGQKGLFGQQQQLSTAGYGLFSQNKSLFGADDTRSSHLMFDLNPNTTKLSENLSGKSKPGKTKQNKNVTQSVSLTRAEIEHETLKASYKALTARVVALEKIMEVHSNQLGQILQARVETMRTASVLVSSDFVNDSDDDDCTQDYTEDKKGDEDEISVFSNRAKLFRFDRGSDRWKEKGVGDMKILQHKETDKYRLLLCREKVHKLACNHLLSPSIKMTAMPISETSWCWTAVDYADGESKIEQLAVEFKSIEVAQRFKEKVDEILENFKD